MDGVGAAGDSVYIDLEEFWTPGLTPAQFDRVLARAVVGRQAAELVASDAAFESRERWDRARLGELGHVPLQIGTRDGEGRRTFAPPGDVCAECSSFYSDRWVPVHECAEAWAAFEAEEACLRGEGPAPTHWVVDQES